MGYAPLNFLFRYKNCTKTKFLEIRHIEIGKAILSSLGHSTIQVHIFLVTQWVEIFSDGTFYSHFFSEKFIFVFHVKKIKILDFA